MYYIEDEDNQIESKRLVGYFSLSHKTINVFHKALSKKLIGRIHRFARYNYDDKSYTLPVIRIGQLGKNFKDGNNKFITGRDLLELVIESVLLVQKTIGGRFVFLESEDKDKLKEFYRQNGFVEFGKRKLDGDEMNLDGRYLIQWLCYPSKKE